MHAGRVRHKTIRTRAACATSMTTKRNLTGQVLRAIWGKNAAEHGEAPSIALVNPKSADNVAKVVRLASCYGIRQVWWTGNRVMLDVQGKQRLPREERMKGYRDVSMIQHDYIFDQFPSDVTPVAVEVRPNSESLLDFIHPAKPLYVFGPEDGAIDKVLLGHCHRFVVIPTRHCLNLSTAVATVLWDREYKRYLNGEVSDLVTPGQFEKRGLVETTCDLIYGSEET
jgi:tRNA(Leu) C34 or U34 (ribose-2'-O)-methylase TrmL